MLQHKPFGQRASKTVFQKFASEALPSRNGLVLRRSARPNEITPLEVSELSLKTECTLSSWATGFAQRGRVGGTKSDIEKHRKSLSQKPARILGPGGGPVVNSAKPVTLSVGIESLIGRRVYRSIRAYGRNLVDCSIRADCTGRITRHSEKAAAQRPERD
jgi:hypothetical protein